MKKFASYLLCALFLGCSMTVSVKSLAEDKKFNLNHREGIADAILWVAEGLNEKDAKLCKELSDFIRSNATVRSSYLAKLLFWIDDKKALLGRFQALQTEGLVEEGSGGEFKGFIYHLNAGAAPLALLAAVNWIGGAEYVTITVRSVEEE